MGLALLTAAISVVAGLVAAIAAHARLWVLAPVRAFAIVAVAAAIAVHVLPEAIAAAGWGVMVPLAIGFFTPPLLGRTARALDRHRRLAAELGYAGVLVHQLGDGLGLGAVTATSHGGHTHWDFLLGIGAHTVPLVAVVALAFAELGGPRAAIVRAMGLLAATAIGIALTRVDESLMTSAGPWLNAAVSGLLFHVLLHDADDRDVPRAARPLEALGAAAGALMPFVLAHHDHDGDAGGADLVHLLRDDLDATVLALAPVLLVGGALAALLAPGHRRSPRTLVAIVAGPATVIAVVAIAYLAAARRAAGVADGVAAQVDHLASAVPYPIQLGAALVLGAVVLGRIAQHGFMAWLGAGRAHGHDHGH